MKNKIPYLLSLVSIVGLFSLGLALLSLNDNHFKANVSGGECGECLGGVGNLTIKYEGLEAANIKIEQLDDQLVIFENTVEPEGEINISNENTFGSEIVIYVNETENARIRTQCEEKIGPELKVGDFEVINGESKDGGELCSINYVPDEDGNIEGDNGEDDENNDNKNDDKKNKKDNDKITICHRTGSDSNPYNALEVDQSAVDGEGNNDHTQHIADEKHTYGDIIPIEDLNGDGEITDYDCVYNICIACGEDCPDFCTPPECSEDETQQCTGKNGCNGAIKCENGQWSTCTETQKYCDTNCDGSPECTNADCPVCACEPDEVRSCDDVNGCEGYQDCDNGSWGLCIPMQNYCDTDCNGTQECTSEACAKCSCKGETTQSCYDSNGCTGEQECINGFFSLCSSTQNYCDTNCDGIQECTSEACAKCSCEGETTQSCYDSNGCYGYEICGSSLWGSCMSTQNYCDVNCNGAQICTDQPCPKCGCEEGETKECYNLDGDTGKQECINSEWTDCEVECFPSVEVCDGRDNDCDGYKDENLSRPCGCDCANAKVLLVLDDNNNGEDVDDFEKIYNDLISLDIDVDRMNEPSDGLLYNQIKDYDLVWFSNPGWPMDDMNTVNSLIRFFEEGNPVVLQGDDMTWGMGNVQEETLKEFTLLENIDNGQDGNYDVVFSNIDHPLLRFLKGKSFMYQEDDIDSSVPINDKLKVLATGAYMNNVSIGGPAIVLRDESDSGKGVLLVTLLTMKEIEPQWQGLAFTGNIVNWMLNKTDKCECGTEIGACTIGTQTCEYGVWSGCGGIPPIPEICNGIDDDCNDLIDDEIECGCIEGETEPCGTDVGACETGERVCIGGVWSECDATYPTDEICGDKTDNDCDGAVDEDCQTGNTGTGGGGGAEIVINENEIVNEEGIVVEGYESSSAVAEISLCGNGIIDAGEDCDDGNTDNNDLCGSNCRRVVCLEYVEDRDIHFVDLPANEWFTPYVTFLEKVRIIDPTRDQFIMSGYSSYESAIGDRLIGIGDFASRLQAVKMALISNCIPIYETLPLEGKEFNDLPRRRYHNNQALDFSTRVMYTALDLGIIDGYGHNNEAAAFGITTRAEILKIFANASGFNIEEMGNFSSDEIPDECRWADVEESSWFYPYTKFVCDNRLINAIGEQYAYPDRPATRAELIVLASRMMYITRNDLRDVIKEKLGDEEFVTEGIVN